MNISLSHHKQGWHEYAECRKCKWSTVEAIGLSFSLLLTGCQSLFIAGCLSGEGENYAWVIRSGEAIAEPVPEYHSNAEEADNRIWRHVTQSWATNILIYSPDTDVYNIGIGIGLTSPTLKQYIIQVNVLHSADRKEMPASQQNDLASLPRENLGVILQTLFISTGCDFVSYLKSLGKATILNTFQHAEFICGVNMPGCLHHTLEHNKSGGFLSFI